MKAHIRRIALGLALTLLAGLVAFSLSAVVSARAASSDRSAPVTTLQAILDLVSGLRQGSNGETRLLFLHLNLAPGTITQIEIHNTALDSYGTTGTTGSCELRFAGVDRTTKTLVNLVRSTPAIPPGGVLILTPGDGTIFPEADFEPVPPFFGYMIATCAFPLAHGRAFTVVGGTIITATGPALVLPSTRSTSFVEANGH